ncbi:hypothetical protein K474DRAFT_1648638 [Panus rudis PR-1116 ss-1]|nr:hypothetical protein K474DRAFT_1648638 [Panus rudis PR-1116 ss-1]
MLLVRCHRSRHKVVSSAVLFTLRRGEVVSTLFVRERLIRLITQRVYCSVECLRNHWPEHKKECGKTDRISLESFYPFLAYMWSSAHQHRSKPMHPALLHQIVNDVNPSAPTTHLPDGWEAKLVMIDDTSPVRITGDNMRDWFPLSYSDSVATKLSQRIMSEGYVLPIATSIATSLLVEMYTTTSGSESERRRIRLKYRSSPIADFGIVSGSVPVIPNDRLAYYKMSNGEIFRGQDPDDHYWIYFTSIRGEQVLLDCAMFTFNLCEMIFATPYIPPAAAGRHHLITVPAFFSGREIRKNTPPLYHERKRMSILRDPALHEAVKQFEFDDDGLSLAELSPFFQFMEKLSGRGLRQDERALFAELVKMHCDDVADVLGHSSWQQYPEAPQIAIFGDPGELQDSDDRAEEWARRNL